MLENKKRKILFFVSLIGIMVVSWLLATTYAYQTIQVDYAEGSDNTLGEKDNGIKIGKLNVKFTANNYINLTNIPFLPDYKTADYTEFTITDIDSTAETAYSISLIDLEYDDVLATSIFRYSLVKINDDSTQTLITSGDFSDLSGNSFNIIFGSGYYRDLKLGGSEKLRLYLWLEETGDTLDDFENTSFKGTIEIVSLFSNEIVENSLLSGVIYRNAKNNTDETKTTYYETPLTTPGVSVSGENERGLSYTSDDYGLSYYYRGNVLDNFVNFNNMCWRILRVQGDGAIKLILEDKGSLCDDSTNYTGNWSYGNVTFGYNSYYNLNGIATHIMDYLNSGESGMADKFLEFQNTYLTNVTDKISATGWCHDTSAYTDNTGTTKLSEEDKNNYYAIGKELYYGAAVRITNSNITMICPVETLTKFNDNSDMYVGAITLDEAIYAGFQKGKKTNNFLLNKFQANNSYMFRTLTPYYYKVNSATTNGNLYDYNFTLNYNGGISYITAYGTTPHIRPVIVLDSDTIISNGDVADGTQTNPYVIS